MTATPSLVLARVDEELRALWTAPSTAGEPPKSRACTMNLVVVGAGPDFATQCIPVIDRVVAHVPARAILVGLDPDGPDDLEASVAAVCAPEPGGAPSVCSERVTLVARGALCTRLWSCVDAICATDVPMTLVWLARVHSDDLAFIPLARGASRIVLDSALSSIASLSRVVRYTRAISERERPGLGDLAWTRLASWQELCARMFDPPRLRPLIQHVNRIRIVQAAPDDVLGPEAALLLGWMATRLGWKTASLAGNLRLVRPDGGYVQIQLRPQLQAGGTGGRGRERLIGIEIAASSGELTMQGEIASDHSAEADAATWRVQVSEGGEAQRLEQHTYLRGVEPAQVLERTLHRPPHDDALADAVLWADELRGEELAYT
ncbi:MAG TPA: glucose-6-phosphate dehydrogenase assembly protein OpcA [Polyangiaceae bacterium]|nr:glucose-6-phosphate dehydrogenase assembly protein OpcA [Polyangiaceae bacterium]